MKNTITNLIVAAVLSISGAAFAAGEEGPQARSMAIPAPAASAVPPATIVESKTAPAEKPQPAAKPSTSAKRAKARAVRPKDLDLRHCLELDNNPAIARCARE